MKQMMGIFAVALSAVAVTAVAGDLTVEGSLNVTSNITCQALAAPTATVGSLAVSGSVSLVPGSIAGAALASGSVGTNAAAAVQWNAWADGRYLRTSGTGNTDLVLGVPGRIVAGYGVNLTNSDNTAYGAMQLGANHGTQYIGPAAMGASQKGYNDSAARQNIGQWALGSSQNGYNYNGIQSIGTWATGASQNGYNYYGTQTIGEMANGASQNGYNEGGTKIIGEWAAGASQDGYGYGIQTIGDWSLGAKQFGANCGTLSIGTDAYGASQYGYNEGTEVIGNCAYGAEQRGAVNYSSSCATNNGVGSIQLLNLSSSQKALITGHASIGMGACTVTHDQAIVAGDGLVSHGKGTITANGFYGAGAGITNLNLSAYAGDNLTWSDGQLHAADSTVYTDANAVAAVTAANLDMNSHRITGVADATAATDAVNLQTATDLIQQGLLNVGPFGNLSMGQFTAR